MKSQLTTGKVANPDEFQGSNGDISCYRCLLSNSLESLFSCIYVPFFLEVVSSWGKACEIFWRS